jgi:cob(I)alamin adenosyltransferase
MRIYSKTGDKGTTSLLGGKRVSKSHLRIETYGTVDELISYIGLLRDQVESQKIHDELIRTQDKLMVCASLLAADCDNCKSQLPKLYESDITHLENVIDEMERELPPLRSFILPGGHSTVSICHITRNVCRRAERYIIRMHEEEGTSELVISYVNRLSDFFFVLGRKLSKDLSIKEVIWNPKK